MDQGKQLKDEEYDVYYAGRPIGLILGRHRLQIGRPSDFEIMEATEEFVVVNPQELRDPKSNAGQFPLGDSRWKPNPISFGANVVASRLGFGIDRFPVVVKREGNKIIIRDFGGPASPPTIVVTPIGQ